MARARIGFAGGVLGLVTVIAAAVPSPTGAAVSTDEVWLAFNAAKGGVVLTTFPNSGSAATTQSLT